MTHTPRPAWAALFACLTLVSLTLALAALSAHTAPRVVAASASHDTQYVRRALQGVTSPTNTATVVPTETSTATTTPTVVPSPIPETATPEITVTASITPTETTTPTLAPTDAVTVTTTPTLTVAPPLETATLEPTYTATVTLEPSVTPSPAITLTPSVTPTATLSPTPAPSATLTLTPTPAPPTATPTVTLTPTPDTGVCDPTNPAHLCGATVMARVFLDLQCDRYFNFGTDEWLKDVPVTVRLANGQVLEAQTSLLGTTEVQGVGVRDVGLGATISIHDAIAPDWVTASGLHLVACTNSPLTRPLAVRDFVDGVTLLDFRYTVAADAP